ncbi:serine--tRNA ligase, mitochondrial [Microplitis mediator]|uniref:serine--tRNA ligase, mitochondrial n=1 Tax=Microplitis mediator TaxID=375433 RepID=UPI002557748C|nr:serine--tRNA ligase, mitochondrial [Microplitis mediator]
MEICKLTRVGVRLLNNKNLYINFSKSISTVKIPSPNLDTSYICDPKNRTLISENIKHRKGVGDIDKVLQLSKDPDKKDEFLKELSRIPNKTDPRVLKYGEEGKILSETPLRTYDFQPQTFIELAKNLKLIRIDQLGPVSGPKSYILLGDLAQLEEALVQFSVKRLLECGFRCISVPDILPKTVIERCGMIVDGDHTLIYTLDKAYGDVCLSGTAEMALAMHLMNKEINEEKLPVKLAAVSRCFRAEASNNAEESGIYRVHQFTKVEMFACASENKSSEFLEEMVKIQENISKDLGLGFKIIDMPSHDLGAPAYRKIDIEGWLPGKNSYGELSSCSNCTDFQSRRLNIRYKNSKSNELKYVHTLNGTACAIPRMLIAICESYQLKDGRIEIPKVLVPFMNGKTIIETQKVGDMRTYKYKTR